MEQTYLSIDGEYESLIIIDRSKFICHIKGIKNEDEAKEYINAIKKQNSLATHNCYAYITGGFQGDNQKFSDDGEPKGTAGMPILEVLKNNNLKNVVAVVTRYFGGVKLGTGGLVRAYTKSVVETLNISALATHMFASSVLLQLSYEQYPKFLKLVESLNFAVHDTNFDDVIYLIGVIPKYELENFEEKLSECFLGKLKFQIISEGFYPFKNKE